MPILPGISDFLSMLVVGLEPTRGCPQQILSLPRLPFRHTSIPTTELYNIITAIGWQVISAKNTFYVGCKIKIKKFYQIEFCCSLCRVDDLFIYPAVPGGDINARL